MLMKRSQMQASGGFDSVLIWASAPEGIKLQSSFIAGCFMSEMTASRSSEYLQSIMRDIANSNCPCGSDMKCKDSRAKCSLVLTLDSPRIGLKHWATRAAVRWVCSHLLGIHTNLPFHQSTICAFVISIIVEKSIFMISHSLFGPSVFPSSANVPCKSISSEESLKFWVSILPCQYFGYPLTLIPFPVKNLSKKAQDGVISCATMHLRPILHILSLRPEVCREKWNTFRVFLLKISSGTADMCFYSHQRQSHCEVLAVRILRDIKCVNAFFHCMPVCNLQYCTCKDLSGLAMALPVIYIRDRHG